MKRLLFLLALAALLAVSTLEAAALFRFYQAQSRLPLWDMAGHGWGGVELLRALQDGHPLRFLGLLNHQDKWPFGYSLLLLPFLAAGNASFASATLLSTVLFALVPVLMLWAAREVDAGPAGFWGGLLGAALFLASPLARVFGILIMRETAGVFFSLLALGLYLRARRLGTAWAWRLAGLAFLALFLVKYNYALIWAFAVLANEIVRLPPERRRELGRQGLLLLRPWRQPGLGRLALAVWLDLLILALLLGINPGVGIYAGLVAGAAVLAVRFFRDREAPRSRWRSLPVEIRAALATVVIPLGLWCLSPMPIHPKEIIAFLRNRAAGPPLLSSASLSYYFRSLMGDSAALPFLGGLVIVFLVLSLLWRRTWKTDEPWRVLSLMTFLGLILATFHPFKEPRFFATTAPFVMLLAGISAARLAGRRWIGGLLCAAALAGIAWTAIQADLGARLARDYKIYSGRPGFWRPLAFLADHAEGAHRLAVIGTFNELSDSLVRWWLALDEDVQGIEMVRSPSRRGDLRDWLAKERPDRILAVRLLPKSRFYRGKDFQLYNAWQLAAVSALEKDPAWRITRRKRYEGMEVEILVLDRNSRR
ncbi:MAG TPA: hypothetical protein VHC97_13185 [Thermoanaerobaculia bacterium]|nr:hypothetical protein [Thermoanaerobaculia bacterium]